MKWNNNKDIQPTEEGYYWVKRAYNELYQTAMVAWWNGHEWSMNAKIEEWSVIE